MTSIELERRLARRLATASRLDLLGLSAAAWVALVVWSRSMANGPGAMGLGVGGFVGAWTVMMAAMMLPAAAATGAESPSTGASLGVPVWKRHAGTLLFALAFIGVWAILGIGAYWAALGTGDAAGTGFGPRLFAAGLFVVFGVFQLSAVKARSLGRCRNISYSQGDVKGFGQAAGCGLRYGVTCVAGSWATMGLMFAFGLMSVGAMAVLAGVIYAERRWAQPLTLRVTGLAGLMYGMGVLVWPALAPGLHSATMAMPTGH